MKWLDAMVDTMTHKGQGVLNQMDSSEVSKELPQAYQTGRMWTPKSSEELLQFMDYVKGRYGLDTAVMVGATLSEFTEMVSRIPNISDRRKSAMSSLQKLRGAGLSRRDELIIVTYIMNMSDNPRIVWETEILPSGIVRIRSRFT